MGLHHAFTSNAWMVLCLWFTRSSILLISHFAYTLRTVEDLLGELLVWYECSQVTTHIYMLT